MPTRLNLKNKSKLDQVISEQTSEVLKLKTLKASAYNPKMTILEPDTEATLQKNLAIFFIYNGHDWEAHSVLGVAQGAQLKIVTEAYQLSLQKTDPQSYPFLEAAYQAILIKKRRDVL